MDIIEKNHSLHASSWFINVHKRQTKAYKYTMVINLTIHLNFCSKKLVFKYSWSNMRHKMAGDDLDLISLIGVAQKQSQFAPRLYIYDDHLEQRDVYRDCTKVIHCLP